jgi:hypothetical protein
MAELSVSCDTHITHGGKNPFYPMGRKQDNAEGSLNVIVRGKKKLSTSLLGARDKLMHPIANHYTY